MRRWLLRVLPLVCFLALPFFPPTARAADAPNTPDTDVYAILYDDGTLVFQHGDTPEAGRTVTETYLVDLVNGYTWDSSAEKATTPWYNMYLFIRQVDFRDRIQPQSTAYWFFNCYVLMQITNITNLDTSNVTNMNGMFAGCTSLMTLDVSSFDTSNVTNMNSMFLACSGIVSLNLSHFDTSSVTDMNSMFYYCTSLTALDISGFDTSNVIFMPQMFRECRSLTSLDVSDFDTSEVWVMMDMFSGCNNLKTIYASEYFVTSQVKISDDMFSGCTTLVGGNGTAYDEDHTDATYARIDNPPDALGYFTYKEPSARERVTIQLTTASGGTQNVTLPAVDGASILCAFYDAAGRMTGVQWVTVTANSGSVAATDRAAAVKFFTLDADFVPRANAVSVSLS